MGFLARRSGGRCHRPTVLRAFSTHKPVGRRIGKSAVRQAGKPALRSCDAGVAEEPERRLRARATTGCSADFPVCCVAGFLAGRISQHTSRATPPETSTAPGCAPEGRRNRCEICRSDPQEFASNTAHSRPAAPPRSAEKSSSATSRKGSARARGSPIPRGQMDCSPAGCSRANAARPRCGT